MGVLRFANISLTSHCRHFVETIGFQRYRIQLGSTVIGGETQGFQIPIIFFNGSNFNFVL